MCMDIGPRSDLASTGVLLVVGAIFSVISSVWMYFEAQAAVNVRPELAEVGFMDAFLTSHGFDWLFYHRPVIGFVSVFGLYGVMGVVYLVFDRR